MAKPLFRYSSSRDGYILRGVGRSFGPVLRTRTARVERPLADTERPDTHAHH